MKMVPSRVKKNLRELSEKKFLLSSDVQSNTKNIRVILKPGPSGDLVLKVNFVLVVALYNKDS